MQDATDFKLLLKDVYCQIISDMNSKSQIPLRYLVTDRFEAGRRPAARAR